MSHDLSDNPFDRLPPHSLEAEMCLLGSMIIDRHQAEQIVTAVQPDDFFLTDHKIVFEALRALITTGRSSDAVILRDELKVTNQLDAIGGAAYVAQLMASVPSSAHAKEYAARVREYAARRSLLSLCDDVSRRSQAGTDDAATLANEMTNLVGEVLQRRSAGELIAWDQLVDSTYEEIGSGGLETVPFGWHELDQITGGMGLGESVVLAARPSMGKSTAARNIAIAAATAGHSVGIISLEEGAKKIARNAMAANASVTNHRLRHANDISAAEYQRLAGATARMRGLPITLSRTARTVDEIRAAATTMKSRHGIKLLIVDHLSRVRAPGRDLYQQVTAASGAMSDLVRDLNVAGLILCQLNRGVEHRDSQRPTMADLRDSGAIEQDADGILLLHREDYYGVARPDYQQDGVAELIIAKWRDGRRGKTVRLQSELQYQRFVDMPFPGSSPPPFEPNGQAEEEAE